MYLTHIVSLSPPGPPVDTGWSRHVSRQEVTYRFRCEDGNVLTRFVKEKQLAILEWNTGTG